MTNNKLYVKVRYRKKKSGSEKVDLGKEKDVHSYSFKLFMFGKFRMCCTQSQRRVGL